MTAGTLKGCSVLKDPGAFVGARESSFRCAAVASGTVLCSWPLEALALGPRLPPRPRLRFRFDASVSARHALRAWSRVRHRTRGWQRHRRRVSDRGSIARVIHRCPRCIRSGEGAFVVNRDAGLEHDRIDHDYDCVLPDRKRVLWRGRSPRLPSTTAGGCRECHKADSV
jgi:hypothetical protein